MKQLYSRYFPTPSYLSMNSAALDISDQSIKFGELRATQNGLQLGRFGQVSIPAGVIVSGKIENEDILIATLKDLKEKEQLMFVRVALPDEQMYLFTLTIPQLDLNIREAILLQLEEYIPLAPLDTTFDYIVVSETDEVKIIEVTAIATTTVERYVSVFKKAGLYPLSFELEAQANARVVIPYNDPSTVMIVDFGASRTGLSIANRNFVFFTTTLDIGGATLTNMIAKNFSLTPNKAEEMKRSYGLASELDVNEIFPIILNGISVLRDELNKHYVYWKTHETNTHKEIDRIVLCGEDSNLAGLADYLQTSMKIKVVHADAWVNILNMDLVVPDMSREESLGYTTMLGLALGDYTDSTQSRLSVLPQKEKKALQFMYRIRLTSVALSLIAILGLIATVLLLPSYFFSESKMNFADGRLEAFNAANPGVQLEDLDPIIADTNAKLALLSKVPTPYPIEQKAIESVIANRTPGITLTEFIYTEKTTSNRTIEVHGTALTRDFLYAFKAVLDANPNFAKADLPLSYAAGSTDIHFVITIKLK